MKSAALSPLNLFCDWILALVFAAVLGTGSSVVGVSAESMSVTAVYSVGGNPLWNLRSDSFVTAVTVSPSSNQQEERVFVAAYNDNNTVVAELLNVTLSPSSGNESILTISGVVFQNLVRNPNSGTPYAGCLPSAGVDPFSASYPIVPNAIHAAPCPAASGVCVVIADHVPSSLIFELNSNSRGSVAYTRAPILGSTCDFNQSVTFVNGTVASGTHIANPNFAYLDSATGDVYVTQSYSVVRVDAATGLVEAYFGNESQMGDQNETFNYVTTRWDATTKSPSHVDIDPVTRTMYVTEGGMLVIRAIDMASGSAAVVLGKLSYITFPPVTCQDDNCTVSDVVLVGPVASVVYRSPPESTFNHHWLLVADYTAAVVYRLNLETGTVSIIAGEMLRYRGVTQGGAASLLRSIRSISVGYRHLYIADSGLRVLELEPAPPTPPPATPQPVTPATQGIVTTAATASILSGGTATGDAVAIIMVTGLSCTAAKTNSVSASILQSTFLFAQTLQVLAVQPWALFLVFLGFFGIHTVISGALNLVGQDRPRSIVDVVVNGCARSRFPAFSIAFGEMALPLSMFVSWRTVFNIAAAAGDISSGVLALLAQHAVVALACYVWLHQLVARVAYFTAHKWLIVPCATAVSSSIDGGKAASRDSPTATAGDGVSPLDNSTFAGSFTSLLEQDTRPYMIAQLESTLLPVGFWGSRSVRASFGPLFNKCTPEQKEWKIREYTLAAVTALLSAIAGTIGDQAACRGALATLGIVYVVFAAHCAVIARPFRLPADNILAPLSQTIFSVVCFVKAFAPDESAAADTIQLLQSVVILLRVLLAFYVWLRERRVAEVSSDDVRSNRSNDGGTTTSPHASSQMFSLSLRPDDLHEPTDLQRHQLPTASFSFTQDTSKLAKDEIFFTTLQARGDEDEGQEELVPLGREGQPVNQALQQGLQPIPSAPAQASTQEAQVDDVEL